MPKVLYIRGELPDPGKPAVAVVGARACSRYGEQQAYRFGKLLGKTESRSSAVWPGELTEARREEP